MVESLKGELRTKEKDIAKLRKRLHARDDEESKVRSRREAPHRTPRRAAPLRE